ncbi:MAG: energy-coupling factor ABC transporter ATP-binding protein [Clostridia bacterium]|nr:energy-coupling factor ABC transporter ATP-binding protein [Clostridia bacterium]
MIHAKNISFSYPDGNQALNKVSIDIKTGSTVAVVGANGAGKSTLLSLLIGIHTAKEGEIQIAGISMEKKNLEEIRKKVGFVFQNPDDQLFMARVYDDITFGPRNFGYSTEEITKMADKAIETMKIEHLKDRAPHKLSGGEKRNVAIAAVLAMNPEVLLFDEPNSYLDPKNRRNFIHAMSELQHTKLIATHDLDMVLDLCQRVIILRKGEVFADGDPMELFRDMELMEQSGLEIPLSLQNRG